MKKTSAQIRSEGHPRQRRLRWTVLMLAFALFGLDQAYRLILQRQVRTELQALRKEGYPVTPSELAKSVSALPDSENDAAKILEAADSLVLFPDSFSPNRWPVKTEDLGPEERDSLREALTNNAAALNALHAAAPLKQSRFPVEYELGPAAGLPHLVRIKGLSRLLQAEAYLYSDEGQPELAVRSIVDGISLARSLDQEPILISQWVRMSCLAMHCASLERVLNQHTLRPAQLAALTEAFQGAEQSNQDALARGFGGETCLGVFCFTAPPDQFVALLNPEGPGPLALTRAFFPLYTWTGLKDRDYLFYLSAMREMIEATKAPFPEGLTLSKTAAGHIHQCLPAHHFKFVSRLLLSPIERVVDRTVEMQARLRCARTALALELYRQERHRALPEALGQLAPAILPSVLTDPADGAPLRYHPWTGTAGYVLYSIGADRTDNGGVGLSAADDAEAWKWPPGTAPSNSRQSVTAQRRSVDGSYDVILTVER